MKKPLNDKPFQIVVIIVSSIFPLVKCFEKKFKNVTTVNNGKQDNEQRHNKQ